MIKIGHRLHYYCILFYSLLILSSCNSDFVNGPSSGNGKDDVADVYGHDYLFDIHSVPLIRLDVTLSDWNRLLEMYDINSEHKELIPAHFSFKKGDEAFDLDSIGIRVRGNTSRRRPEGSYGQMHEAGKTDWHHCHFALRLDEYKEKQKFCGVDRFNLKWHKDDASYCREIYSYDLFKRFGVWSAPRASYCRVELYVEGDKEPAYLGVYVLLEAVHKDFLKERHKAGQLNGKGGNLWKASWGADLLDASSGRMGVEEVTLDPGTSKKYVYDLKTNKTELGEAKQQLRTFMSNLKNLKDDALKSWAEEHMYVDQFLRAYAVNVVVGMWDDYWKNTNNFYIYFDEHGKFLFIPYDYDNTLGTSGMMENSGTQNPMRWGEMDGRPLVTQLLSIPEYNERYKGYLKELVNDASLFAYSGSRERIIQWQNMISGYVKNDTNEDMEVQDIPASWGNCHFYRLKSGNDLGGSNGSANFFLTKTRVINEL